MPDRFLIILVYAFVAASVALAFSPSDVKGDVLGAVRGFLRSTWNATESFGTLRTMRSETDEIPKRSNVDTEAKWTAVGAPVSPPPTRPWPRDGGKRRVMEVEDASSLVSTASPAEFPNDVVIRGDGVCLRSLEEAVIDEEKREENADDHDYDDDLRCREDSEAIRMDMVREKLNTAGDSPMSSLVDFRNRQTLIFSANKCSSVPDPEDLTGLTGPPFDVMRSSFIHDI
jgi:hypothetical protein